MHLPTLKGKLKKAYKIYRKKKVKQPTAVLLYRQETIVLMNLPTLKATNLEVFEARRKGGQTNKQICTELTFSKLLLSTWPLGS